MLILTMLYLFLTGRKDSENAESRENRADTNFITRKRYFYLRVRKAWMNMSP